PRPPSSAGYFEPFTAPHFLVLGLFLLAVIFMVVFRKRLAASKLEPRIRVIGTIVALFFEISLHILQYLTQDYYDFLRGVIPLELCGISLWLSVALNASKRRWVFDLLYFWGWGAAASLLFYNTDGAGWNSFRFWQYFAVHAYVLLTMAWFTAVHGYRVRFATLVKAIAVLFPITLVVRLFDTAWSGAPYKFNFMFLVSPPDVHSPLDSFGHGWGYYAAFALLSIAVFVAAWVPWGLASLIEKTRGAKPETAIAASRRQ
ncbi:MAG TPA: TIGR02206 family membrane protein, partial [Rectinemataceae bacterium]|nr:TIGR02206 family membrane protein [Rectinemataceae bacterium]